MKKHAAAKIEELARKLERVRILVDLRKCESLEDYQALEKKYEALCNEEE
ncbi:MAG: hypothetical protein IJ682_03305 [Lachnospiraceae bacterium]|nr:hypothetical protein [Lachnospiraceae bacterium]